MHEKEQLRRDVWEFINRSKHKACISSIPQLNGNSIEFSLSTWTRSRSKVSLSKFLQNPSSYVINPFSFHFCGHSTEGDATQKVEVYKPRCYESPKQEKVSHAFEHLIQNLKAYNRVRI